ncbi:MAG TPA: hypothetical protein VFK59_13180 [Actinomycetota bacterium]|nr:hypothetical protein [Actinomycetota bacterium]
MQARRFAAAALVLAALAACTEGTDGATGTGPTPTSPSAEPPITPVETPSVTASPTRPPLPEEPPATSGPAALDCVNGWTTPSEDSNVFTSPLGVIRRTTQVEGPLVVVDMRYFEGPESPPSDKGYLLVVERWYVKLFAERDFSFAGRFLVEARRFGQGVAAVASYGSTGYRSPDWVGFQYDSADPERRTYEGLPGTWAGVPYDFVEGGAGIEIPGLPSDVVGCLSGT